mgnify:CR=1 FL=1
MDWYIRNLTEYYNRERSKRVIGDNELVALYNNWRQGIQGNINFECSVALLKYLQDLNFASKELRENIYKI